jgi:hypothetical protein
MDFQARAGWLLPLEPLGLEIRHPPEDAPRVTVP